jgi:hypothetical protein
VELLCGLVDHGAGDGDDHLDQREEGPAAPDAPRRRSPTSARWTRSANIQFKKSNLLWL